MQKAKKNNAADGKPEIGYLHPETMKQLAYAQQAGAKKYGRFNYLKGHNSTQLVEATIRHLYQYLWEGDVDADSTERLGKEVTHLGAALANLNMLITQQAINTLTDDRPVLTIKENTYD